MAKYRVLTRAIHRANEYGDVLNIKVDFCPPETSGRGVCVVNERCLEFQTARFASKKGAVEKSSELQDEVQMGRWLWKQLSIPILRPAM